MRFAEADYESWEARELTLEGQLITVQPFAAKLVGGCRVSRCYLVRIKTVPDAIFLRENYICGLGRRVVTFVSSPYRFSVTLPAPSSIHETGMFRQGAELDEPEVTLPAASHRPG